MKKNYKTRAKEILTEIYDSFEEYLKSLENDNRN